MLKWLFGKTAAGAERSDDHVWKDPAARRRGIVRRVAALANEGRAVLVVARDRASFDELRADLAAHEPAACSDVRGRSACRDAVGRAATVTVALASELPPDLPRADAPPVDVLVVGRDTRRTTDDGLAALADGLGTRARVTFHATLDDAVIPLGGSQLKELLAKLGMSDDEPIVHAFVTRAIANAQRQQDG